MYYIIMIWQSLPGKAILYDIMLLCKQLKTAQRLAHGLQFVLDTEIKNWRLK